MTTRNGCCSRKWELCVLYLLVLSVTLASSDILGMKCYETISNNDIHQAVGVDMKPQKAPEETIAQVTVYTGNDGAGFYHKLTFKTNECQDLPEYIWNRAKSVNTHGTCVQLCEYKNCGGWCVKFQPGSPSHNRLRKLRFHNRAKSGSPCSN